MTAKTAYNLKRFTAVAIAFTIATGIFAFFYGKQYAENLNQQALIKVEAKRQKENAEAAERIRQRDLAIAKSDDRNEELERQLQEKEIHYVYIDKKHDKRIDSVNTLPLNGKVQFLASWLSQTDSIQWRYVGSNN